MAARLRLRGLCRGADRAYAVVSGRGVEGTVTCVAHLARGGRAVPALVRELYGSALSTVGARAGERAWVVSVPLLGATCLATLTAGGTTCLYLPFPSPTLSRAASRLFAAARPAAAALMRASSSHAEAGLAHVDVVWAAPASAAPGASNVWRVATRLPAHVAAPHCRVLTAAAVPLACAPQVLEDHVALVADEGALVRDVTFSLTLPPGCVAFTVVVEADGVAVGFASMTPARAQAMLSPTRRALNAVAGDEAYATWLAARRPSPSELRRQAREAASVAGPTLSLVMPVYDPIPEHLAAAVASVVAQSYGHWELVVVDAGPDHAANAALLAAWATDGRVRVVACDNRSIADNTNLGIDAATGSYVGFMDHDDVIEPDTLWRYARAIADRPAVDLIYCDEDHLDEGGRVHAPFFKPGPSLGKLYGYNYVTHLLMVSRRVLALTERSAANVSGAQDFDLTLKAFEVAREIVHVPHVLYHWREHRGSTSGGSGEAKPFAHEAGRRALAAHLARCGIAGSVGDGPLPYTYRVRPRLAEPAPTLSVIIPNRDHAALLATCVRSLLHHTDYPSYEVIIVENGSVEDATFALYSELAADARVRIVTWDPPTPGAFNYAAVCNLGASVAGGDALLFLNNDTEVTDAAWMRELVGCLARPEVGVVGALLVFPDGLVQHAGVVANGRGELMHANEGVPADALGYGYGVALPADVSMVTGACQLVRASVFNELGGYDEGLAVGFNDADLCLRAREAGHVVAYTPYARLTHREFASRGREATDVRLKARYLREHARFVERHAAFVAGGDPMWNPNLDRASPLPRLSDV